jgi:ketosteroid isomerase-like protein
MPTPQQSLDRALERWNAGDLEGYLELYADDVTLHGQSPAPLDKDGARGLYTAIMAAFDCPSLAFEEILWAGDDACTIRYRMTGRHVGEFMAVPPANEPVDLEGITVMRFRDGQVVERHTVSDMLGLLIQIGAVPAPAPA